MELHQKSVGTNLVIYLKSLCFDDKKVKKAILIISLSVQNLKIVKADSRLWTSRLRTLNKVDSGLWKKRLRISMNSKTKLKYEEFFI